VADSASPSTFATLPPHFENIGEVEALDVFVTDVLDASLDDSTFQILSPDGSYDANTRTLRWELLGRILEPGETDNVLLSIRPRPGLPSGTVIHLVMIETDPNGDGRRLEIVLNWFDELERLVPTED